jgi:hypothetical protein
MTMPLAAELACEIGSKPSQWTDEEVAELVERIDQDLPGDVLAYLRGAIPSCQACECGALHIDIGDEALDDATRRSLARVFATPFAKMLGEWTKRELGLSGTVKFGWSNLELVAPRFAWAVPPGSPQQSQFADKLSALDLQTAIDAIEDDLPLGFAFIRESAESYDGSDFMARSLSPDEAGGHDRWVEVINQLMVICSTPMLKYVKEWLSRSYDIERFGPINCCRVSFGGGEGFDDLVMTDQITQQLTPDC